MAEVDKSDDDLVQDLWGNWVYRVPRKRGRPRFERTEENSNKVKMLLAMGWTNERIAGTVLDPRTGRPISLPTLKRHFRAELSVRDQARDQLEARQLMAAFQAMEAGNVGAMRLFDQLKDKNDRRVADARLGDRPKESKPEKLGKKEMSAEKAASAEDRLRQEAERARKH